MSLPLDYMLLLLLLLNELLVQPMDRGASINIRKLLTAHFWTAGSISRLLPPTWSILVFKRVIDLR